MLSSSIRKYLDALPNGVASYPECVVKASILRNSLGSRPLGPEVDLPPTIRRLVDEPPTVGEWIPEVHLNVVMLAIREVHFDLRNLDGYRAWAFEQNHKLLGTPLYRILFLVVSPDRLISGVETRWSAFRRGTEMRVIHRAEKSAELQLRYPAFLYPPLMAQSMVVALQAAMEHAGARQPRIDTVSPTSTETRFSVSWS